MKAKKEALFKGFSPFSELEKKASPLESFPIEVPGLGAFFFRLAWKRDRVGKVALRGFSHFTVVR
jgi:hypothetical protein